MADRYTQVVILCEDIMHSSFVRRYLILRGIEPRRIRSEVSPSGRGAGAKFVIHKYPIEVKALRSRPHLRAGLVAVIDADKSSVEDRLRQLEQSLGQPSRQKTDRVGVLVPKRNVETWVFHLLGNDVIETDDYKHRVSTADVTTAVSAFAEQCPAKSAEIAVPSLQHACKELTAFLKS